MYKNLSSFQRSFGCYLVAPSSEYDGILYINCVIEAFEVFGKFEPENINTEKNSNKINYFLANATFFEILRVQIEIGVCELLVLVYLAGIAYSGDKMFAFFNKMTHKT